MARSIDADELPEAHLLVLDILARGGALTWDALVVQAAAVGIGEEELRAVMFGSGA